MKRRLAALTLNLGCLSGLLFYLTWNVGWEAILQALGRADGLTVGAAYLLFLGSFPISAGKMTLALNPLRRIPFFTLLAVVALSFAASVVTPGVLGTFLVSGYLLGRKPGLLRRLMAALAIEKLITLGVALTLALGGLLALPGVAERLSFRNPTGREALWVLALAGAAALGGVFAWRRLRIPALNLWREVRDAYALHPRILPGTALCALLLFMTNSGIWWALLAAFHVPTPYTTLLFLVPMFSILAAIPLLVMGLGVVDGAALVLLALYGVPAEVVAGILLVQRLYMLATGVLIFWARRFLAGVATGETTAAAWADDGPNSDGFPPLPPSSSRIAHPPEPGERKG
ncbi:MAG: flippase-like domain-containing protein [Magnetococcales bacterium]|nr:flippase-like domain-containing protein [Magnetococcales bacterium]